MGYTTLHHFQISARTAGHSSYQRSDHHTHTRSRLITKAILMVKQVTSMYRNSNMVHQRVSIGITTEELQCCKRKLVGSSASTRIQEQVRSSQAIRQQLKSSLSGLVQESLPRFQTYLPQPYFNGIGRGSSAAASANQFTKRVEDQAGS
ncbi:unnamed protein product [Cuscuta campestris]|uniref:Uncharacterized protein n=1 Tax=Cuscuta campestris TaxID=132261 RepID=A0A484LB87_9ASTE|nr:unnamed protein product [Cuscuta campestris]